MTDSRHADASVAAAIAANRFGLGARPGDLARIRDPREWLAAQLAGGPPRLEAAGLESSAGIFAQAMEIRRAIAAARRADGASSAADVMRIGQLYRPIYVAEAGARFQRAVDTDRPFVERLVHFWANHFAVSIDKIAVLGLAGSFEREAIRPHVLGRFADLLLAVEQHPAMLLYLDNATSVGPDSRAARFLARRGGARRAGLNENLAREILELHTLGVDGGYTQADVTTFAQAITGWSVGGRGPMPAGEPGRVALREGAHQPGAKTILGRRYADDGQRQGEAVLRDLARHPATARHLATKLARHFVADDPPRAVVDRLAKAFERSDGDLPTVYRALLEAPEAWQAPLAKYKTPSDYAISAYRGLQLPVNAGRGALLPFEVLGQRTWSPGSPAGWPDRGVDWDGSSALMQRIEWADAVGQRLADLRDATTIAPLLLGGTLAGSTARALSRAASGAQALTLLLTAPEFLRR